MPQYWVAIHHPNDFDPTAESDAITQAIDALNEAMIAAGARFFAGGLQPPRTAKSIQTDANGKVVVSDGSYLESATKEYVGGFWILDATSMDEAVEWGRKASIACRVPVEVRPFY